MSVCVCVFFSVSVCVLFPDNIFCSNQHAQNSPEQVSKVFSRKADSGVHEMLLQSGHADILFNTVTACEIWCNTGGISLFLTYLADFFSIPVISCYHLCFSFCGFQEHLPAERASLCLCLSTKNAC